MAKVIVCTIAGLFDLSIDSLGSLDQLQVTLFATGRDSRIPCPLRPHSTPPCVSFMFSGVGRRV